MKQIILQSKNQTLSYLRARRCITQEKRFLNTGKRWLHQSPLQLICYGALILVLPFFLSGCGKSDTEAAPQEKASVEEVAVQPVEKPSIDTRKLPPDTPPVFPGEDVLLAHPETPELPFGIRKVKPEHRTIEQQPNTQNENTNTK